MAPQSQEESKPLVPAGTGKDTFAPSRRQIGRRSRNLTAITRNRRRSWTPGDGDLEAAVIGHVLYMFTNHGREATI